MNADTLRQLHPQNRQRHWNAPARMEQSVQVAVVGIVIVVDVAGETQFAVEKLVQRAKALQRRRVSRKPALQACQQLVNIAQHLLNIEAGVFVLGQRDSRFKQRKVLIALD